MRKLFCFAAGFAFAAFAFFACSSPKPVAPEARGPPEAQAPVAQTPDMQAETQKPAAQTPDIQTPDSRTGGLDDKDGEKELRAKIAQMLLIGFQGTDLDGNNPVYADIAERGIGGVILFDYDTPSRSRIRNIVSKNQLTRLCAKLQEASAQSPFGAKLFIAIDQEGGAVDRLKTRNGFPKTKSAAELGRGGETAYYAEQTARLLSEMGINLNFAPCVDLNLNPRNPIIGRIGRSFSSDPKVVVDHAAVWVDAHDRFGVFSCIKHFPGHGSSQGDTHRGAVDVSLSWQEEELFPYKKLAGTNAVKFVMTSHVFNAALDPENPATLSRLILEGILRNEMGFAGLIVSDDLDMAAVKANYSLETALEKAVNAGVNILCISNNGAVFDPSIAERSIDIIYNQLRAGKIAPARIEESYRRIMAVKAEL
jgi:beta-N-acetylhexosaminidase